MIIDMHSHILPRLDHGSGSVECSVAQVKRAVEAGIEVIHLSSHYYDHRDDIENFVQRRNEAYKALCDALDEETKSRVRFVLGAEVTLETDLVDRDKLPMLCIGETNNILIEMPKISWTEWTYNAIYNISAKYHVNPIIAHIDRYDEKESAKLYEMGLKIQVNADAFQSFFTRRKMLKRFADSSVHLLGSDVHGKEAKEYDRFEKALKHLEPFREEIMNNAKEILGV